MPKTVENFSASITICSFFQLQVRAYGKAEIIYPGLILNWAGYDKTVGGVERIMPSRCGLIECPPGYTGDKCEVLEKDKIPPTVEYCPPGESLTAFKLSNCSL